VGEKRDREDEAGSGAGKSAAVQAVGSSGLCSCWLAGGSELGWRWLCRLGEVEEAVRQV